MYSASGAAAAVLLLGAARAGDDDGLPRLHALTCASEEGPALSVATAAQYSLYPVAFRHSSESPDLVVLLRDYILNFTEPEDIVLFFDYYDTVFQGGEEEILGAYLEMEQSLGRELLYQGDTHCSSREQEGKYPDAPTPWRFLNSGLYIGRARALQKLFPSLPSPEPGYSDSHKRRLQQLQNWHEAYYLDHQEEVLVDSGCHLMQGVPSAPSRPLVKEAESRAGNSSSRLTGLELKVVQGQLRNVFTNTTPMVLHFTGGGEWLAGWHPQRTGTCAAYEFLHAIGSPALLALVDEARQSRSDVMAEVLKHEPWRVFCGSASPGTVNSQAGAWSLRSGRSQALALLLFAAVLLAGRFALLHLGLLRRPKCGTERDMSV